MSAQTDRIMRGLEGAISRVKQELAQQLLAKLREHTPVRTGETRSRWTIASDGSVTNDAGEAVMRLNDGSSMQEPAGFIERAIDETKDIVGAEVKSGTVGQLGVAMDEAGVLE